MKPRSTGDLHVSRLRILLPSHHAISDIFIRTCYGFAN